jgi:hypothetical protein
LLRPFSTSTVARPDHSGELWRLCQPSENTVGKKSMSVEKLPKKYINRTSMYMHVVYVFKFFLINIEEDRLLFCEAPNKNEQGS